MDALSDRESLVLEAVVDTHIATAEPVGSKMLVERGDLAISAATIRSVMASLVERGFLLQPHTSAGRIPTAHGFRYYVDKLLHLEDVDHISKQDIEECLQGASVADRVLADAGKTLAQLAKLSTVVLLPKANSIKLRRIEFVRLHDEAVLVLLIGMDGSVHNRIVDIHSLHTSPNVCSVFSNDVTPKMMPNVMPSSDAFDQMGRWLSELAQDKSFPEVLDALRARLAETAGDLFALLQTTYAISSVAWPNDPVADSLGSDVRIENPSFSLQQTLGISLDGYTQAQSNIQARALMQLLDERSLLGQILSQAAQLSSWSIRIGRENNILGFDDLALVTAPYGPIGSKKAIGAVGVVGPMRMNYARIVPLVSFTAEALSRLFR